MGYYHSLLMIGLHGTPLLFMGHAAPMTEVAPKRSPRATSHEGAIMDGDFVEIKDHGRDIELRIINQHRATQ